MAKQIFIHTRLSRAYLALARLSCLLFIVMYFIGVCMSVYNCGLTVVLLKRHLIFLTLFLALQVEPRAKSCLHLAWSLALCLTSLQSTPIISKCSCSVSCHVLLGLPTVLLLSSRVHLKARLTGLVVGSRTRRMWPNNSSSGWLLYCVVQCHLSRSCHNFIIVMWWVVTYAVASWNAQNTYETSTMENINHIVSFVGCFPCVYSD